MYCAILLSLYGADLPTSSLNTGQGTIQIAAPFDPLRIEFRIKNNTFKYDLNKQKDLTAFLFFCLGTHNTCAKILAPGIMKLIHQANINEEKREEILALINEIGSQDSEDLVGFGVSACDSQQKVFEEKSGSYLGNPMYDLIVDIEWLRYNLSYPKHLEIFLSTFNVDPTIKEDLKKCIAQAKQTPDKRKRKGFVTIIQGIQRGNYHAQEQMLQQLQAYLVSKDSPSLTKQTSDANLQVEGDSSQTFSFSSSHVPSPQPSQSFVPSLPQLLPKFDTIADIQESLKMPVWDFASNGWRYYPKKEKPQYACKDGFVFTRDESDRDWLILTQTQGSDSLEWIPVDIYEPLSTQLQWVENSQYSGYLSLTEQGMFKNTWFKHKTVPNDFWIQKSGNPTLYKVFKAQ